MTEIYLADKKLTNSLGEEMPTRIVFDGYFNFKSHTQSYEGISDILEDIAKRKVEKLIDKYSVMHKENLNDYVLLGEPHFVIMLQREMHYHWLQNPRNVNTEMNKDMYFAILKEYLRERLKQ